MYMHRIRKLAGRRGIATELRNRFGVFKWNIAAHASETRVVKNKGWKCLESFKTWSWQRMEMTNWSDKKINVVVLR